MLQDLNSRCAGFVPGPPAVLRHTRPASFTLGVLALLAFIDALEWQLALSACFFASGFGDSHIHAWLFTIASNAGGPTKVVSISTDSSAGRKSLEQTGEIRAEQGKALPHEACKLDRRLRELFARPLKPLRPLRLHLHIM